jgi:murein DD-endopeptidase MepM/ murein hydrolase activator NlpD
MSRLVVAGLLAVLLGSGTPAGSPTAPTDTSGPVGAWSATVVAYSAPVPAPVRVVRAFQPPAGPYAAGHRGVDLATRPGQPVRAAGAGVVRFAGDVAGRGVVVIAHADGISTEYEPVVPAVRAGQPVARGQPIGSVAGSHGACGPGRCLHWGARRGDVYLDPMALLAPLGPVRLLPW